MSGPGPGPDDQVNPPNSAPEYPAAPQYPSAPQYQAAPQFEYAGGPGGPGGQGGLGAAPREMPPTVNWASIALITQTVIGIIAILVTFARMDTIVDKIVADNASTDRDAAHTAVVFISVVGLIISVLLLGLAMKIRAGRNWARIVAVVLAVLGILGGLAQFSQPYGGAIAALDAVRLVLNVVILVLLLMPASNAYFKAPQYG
jgi:hypothetical protein